MLYDSGKSLCLCAILTVAPLAAAGANPQQFSLHLTDTNANDSAKLLVADQKGNLFTVSTVVPSVADSLTSIQASNVRVTKTDESGNVLATFVFGGSSLDTPSGAAVDPGGNLVIVGSTDSPDFPLVSPLQTTGGGFVARVDAQLTKLLYSTRLGVSGSASTAVTLDSTGNIFVAGGTPPGFATTPGALETLAPSSSNGPVTSGFVAEISAAGDRVIFSTLYAGGTNFSVQVPGPGGQGPLPAYTAPLAIALDSSENVIIAGITNATDLKVTAGSWSQICGCGGFVAKIGAAGTQLAWGSYIPTLNHALGVDDVNNAISAMTLDSSGNVVIAGTTPPALPVTPNALQANYPPGGSTGAQEGFVAKLNASDGSLNFATYFGGDAAANRVGFTNGPTALAIDSQGTIWVTGGSATVALPSKSGAAILGDNYIAGISADGSSLVSLFTAPAGSAGAGLAITPQGTIAVLGITGSLLISSSAPGPYVMGIVEMSAPLASRAVCARELVSLYGVGIGPATAQVAPIVNGVIPNSLGGIQVLFNGVPATLLYAGPTQINVIVPSAIAFQQTTTIQIVSAAGTINLPAFPVQETIPQVLLTVGDEAVAVNQDGTLNSPTNHAAPGSIVAIWAVGGGAGSTAASDNTINTKLDYGQFLTSVYQYGGAFPSLEVEYAGDAPRQPSGVIQINFRLPANFASGGAYEVQIGAGGVSGFILY